MICCLFLIAHFSKKITSSRRNETLFMIYFFYVFLSILILYFRRICKGEMYGRII